MDPIHVDRCLTIAAGCSKIDGLGTFFDVAGVPSCQLLSDADRVEQPPQQSTKGAFYADRAACRAEVGVADVDRPVLSVVVINTTSQHSFADDDKAAASDSSGTTTTEAPKKSFLVWVIETSGLIGLVILCLSVYFVATVSRMFMELRMVDRHAAGDRRPMRGAAGAARFQGHFQRGQGRRFIFQPRAGDRHHGIAQRPERGPRRRWSGSPTC